MPRVTRRVLASKKEEKVEETQPARSGGRGAKRGKPEPVEETLPIGEPSPSKAARSTRGKEAPPKVETPKANTSRTSSRGRGKKEEEPEPEEEIEEEEAPPPKKGARGGKGKKDEPEEKEKAAPPKRGGRGKKEEVTEDIDETPPTKRAARGGRGQKQDEPEEEEEAPTPKRAARGGRGKKQEEPEEDKEEETPPPKRAARAVRGKKEEPEDVEEEAKPAPKRAARGGRGSRGKKTEEEEEEMDDTKEEAEEVEEEAKPAPKRAARGVRGSRGKKTEEEEEEMDEAKEETEEVEEETKPTPKRAARGGRGSRGKKTEVNEEEEEMDDATEETEEAKPAPKRAVRGGRGSRGKKTELNEEENEEEKVDDAKEEEKVDDAKEETEAVEESPKGRKSRTPTKPEVSAISPSSGGRRSGGRGKKEEVTSPKITPPRSSNKETVIAEVTGDAEKEDENDAPHEKVTDKPMESEELTKEEEKDTSAQIEKDEEMEVDKNELEAVTMEEEKKEETVVAPVSEKDEEIEEAEKDGNKKRKHDDDAAEEESSSKKARVSEAPVEDMPAEEEKNNDAATDFVIVNKEDVPPADSKEVEDALPPPVEEKPEATPEKAQTETEPEPVDQIETEPSIPPSMAAPIIVPLTEAEIGKQCNPIIMDRDENSSTMVEVGSEAASDSGNMSRNLDVSEVTSMDVTSAADQLGEQDESNLSATSSESAKEELSSSSKPTDLPNELPQPTPPIAEEETTTVPEATEPVVEVSQSNAVVSSIPLPSEQSQSPVKLETQPSPVAPTQQSSPSPPIPSEAPAPVPAQPPTKNTIPELQLNSIPLPPDVSMSNSSSDPLPLSPQQPQLPQSIPPLTAHNATNQNGNCKPDENVAQTTPIITPTPAKKPVVLDSSYVPSSPSIVKRKFISNSNFPIELMDPAFCFSVVSYNLLADCHLRRYNYSYTEPQYLEQSYRHSLFLKELEYLDGDIVCMQEVDTDYYQNLLLPAMNSRGYQGVFKKRTQEWYAEGEATFVKSAKFEILSHQGLSLKDLAYEEVEAAGLTGDVARAAKKYLDRADVVLVCKLLSKKTGKHLTVGNIHVLFDPKAPDIQCIQVASAVKELVSRAGSDLNPYIICGDFNSETTSPSYQLAKDGYLSDTHIRNLQSIQSMDNTEGSSRSIIHYMWKAFQHTSSNMKSAYETSVGKEPVITSLNSLVKSCLDYIFYSSSTLYTVGALEVLDPQVVEATGGLPSKDIPSDHLSVKAVFRLK